MASGELSAAEFQDFFLKTSLGHAACFSASWAVHFVCCDWRHIREMTAETIYDQQLNLCVGNKTNGGMGSLYRSKHELIFVFKVGKTKHVNNVGRARAPWPQPDECLGLSQPKRVERYGAKQAFLTFNGQASCHDRGRNPRLLQPRRSHP